MISVWLASDTSKLGVPKWDVYREYACGEKEDLPRLVGQLSRREIQTGKNVPYVVVSRYEIPWYMFIFPEDIFEPLIVRFISKKN